MSLRGYDDLFDRRPPPASFLLPSGSGWYDGSTDARTRGDVNFVATPPGVTFGGNLTSSFTRHYFSFTTKFRREHSTASCSYS